MYKLRCLNIGWFTSKLYTTQTIGYYFSITCIKMATYIHN